MSNPKLSLLFFGLLLLAVLSHAQTQQSPASHPQNTPGSPTSEGPKKSPLPQGPKPFTAHTASHATPSSLHGTVNIILANKNGLIAVTDSRLSSNDGLAMGSAQKLFKLDSKTICTIAGQYSLGSPLQERDGVLGMALVSRIINQLVNDPEWSTLTTVTAKSQAIASGLSLSFQSFIVMNRTLDNMRGRRPADYELQLTVAGFDDSGLQVIQRDLRSNETTGALVGSSQAATPLPTCSDPHASAVRPITINNSFKCLLAGIEKYDRPIFENPKPLLSGISEADRTAVKAYAKAKRIDGGTSLSLPEMMRVAIAAEKYSELKDGNRIGAEVETATLHNGIATVEIPPSINQENAVHWPKVANVQFYLNVNLGISGFGKCIVAHPNALGVMVHASISRCAQDFDRLTFTDSSFNDVVFFYNGTGIPLFDPSNTITNSILKLRGDVTRDDPFVKYMLANFPGLRLVDN